MQKKSVVRAHRKTVASTIGLYVVAKEAFGKLDVWLETLEVPSFRDPVVHGCPRQGSRGCKTRDTAYLYRERERERETRTKHMFHLLIRFLYLISFATKKSSSRLTGAPKS